MTGKTMIGSWAKWIFLILLIPGYVPVRLGAIQQGQSEKVILKFQPRLSGSGSIKGGGRFSFDTYISQDGVVVERRVETFATARKADEKLNAMVRDATKVIEHGPKRPLEGGNTERRWMTISQHRSGEKPNYLVFWREGADVYVLESLSLTHLRAFEDSVYPPPGSK